MKTFSTILAVAVLSTSNHLATAADAMPGGKNMMMESMMKKMDANSDGMLSKDEFMKGHEKMFDRMKGKNGMIDLAGQAGCCMNKEGHQGMDGRQGMQGHESMKDLSKSR